MAKLKKRSDGRYQMSFTYDDKRYLVYGRTKQELEEKKLEKIQKLKARTAERNNPLLDNYNDIGGYEIGKSTKTYAGTETIFTPQHQ